MLENPEKENTMISLKNSKLIWVAIVIFRSTTCAYSYPPDNAAVLYYKAASLYEVDDTMANMLADLQKGEIEVNDKIREFVKKNQLIINTVLDAFGSERIALSTYSAVNPSFHS